MAFYREYELRGRVLIKYFYMDSRDSEPVMVIRLDLRNRFFSVSGSYLSSVIVVDEIRRLFDLLDSPHWSSFIACCSTKSERVRNYELF